VRIGVVIPVFNERALVRAAVERVLATPPPVMANGTRCERRIVLVDDGSTDGTREVVRELAGMAGVVAVFHEGNRGKGAALRTGFATALAGGVDVVLVHDADLEYDPADHAAVLAPILDGRADTVIGSRFIGLTHRVLYFWHAVANRGISLLCGMATNLNLTDVECCSKAFTRRVLERVTIEEERFGVEIELIAKVARLRLEDATGTRQPRVYEVAVTYAGRTYAEGKKIGWRDGVAALGCIWKYGVIG